jgi:hypothetical protein
MTKRSVFQNDVSNCLVELGISLSGEHLVEEGTASVDLACTFDSSKSNMKTYLGIEVDGPSHYTINTLEMTGPAVMR